MRRFWRFLCWRRSAAAAPKPIRSLGAADAGRPSAHHCTARRWLSTARSPCPRPASTFGASAVVLWRHAAALLRPRPHYEELACVVSVQRAPAQAMAIYAAQGGGDAFSHTVAAASIRPPSSNCIFGWQARANVYYNYVCIYTMQYAALSRGLQSLIERAGQCCSCRARGCGVLS